MCLYILRGQIRIVDSDDTWWHSSIVDQVQVLNAEIVLKKHAELEFKSFKKSEKYLKKQDTSKLIMTNYVEAQLDLVGKWWREWKDGKKSNQV